MTGWVVNISRAAVLLAALSVARTGYADELNPSGPRWSRDAGAQVVGLVGHARPGTWTPLLLSLENPGSQPREVVCQLVLPDADGDVVRNERRVVLSSERPQQVWLYGVPSVTSGEHAAWRLRLLDAATLEPLDVIETGPQRWLDPDVRAVGVMGSRLMGLRPYASRSNQNVEYGLITQFEATQFITGIGPDTLPDRWQGLSVLDALIWAPDGGDPGALSEPVRTALRQWVGRGGHLIIVLPSVGNPWPGSAMSDLLPQVTLREVVGSKAPSWLGEPITYAPIRLVYRSLEPTQRMQNVALKGGLWGEASVLLKDDAGRPVVVAQGYGSGRVTLVGIDLSDASLTRQGLPNGADLWKSIFGWRGTVFTSDEIDAEIAEQRMGRPSHRIGVTLDRFVPGLIAMHETATPALLAALILFGVYWLAAGPFGFAVLRMRKLTHHSWVAFAGVVAVFTVVSWGGAAVLRPGTARINHFTVLDVYAGSGVTRARSWASLFVPRHGRFMVDLNRPYVEGQARDSHAPDLKLVGPDTLASPGLDPASGETRFLDPRSYAVPATAPSGVMIPIRATAKPLTLDHMRLTSVADGTGTSDGNQALISADGPVRVVGGWPTARLTHGFSKPIMNLKVIYCPGDGQAPWVWGYDLTDRWEPEETLELSLPRAADRLVRQAQPDEQPRRWSREGYLGQLIAAKTGQSWGGQAPDQRLVADNEVIQAVEMLSFYDMLPPPDYRATVIMSRPANYERSFGRMIDLTKIVALKCLILVGHIDEETLPVPVTVDGENVSSSGWVVVRWVCPIFTDEHPAERKSE